jgi:hypothetical protein
VVEFPRKFSFSLNRFLLVILQLQSVLNLKNPVKIKKQLRNLPNTPTEAYQDLLNRMTSEEQDLTQRVLGWVLLARRIIRMAELQEVLALDEDGPSLDLDYGLPADQVVRLCGGLITHDRALDLVTFSHETVRSFLEEECISLPSHADITRTCLAYLRLPPFEKPHPRSPVQRRVGFEFSYYAAKFWGTHAAQAERDVHLESAILDTFTSSGRLDAVEQLRASHWLYRSGRSLLHVLIANKLSFIFTSPVSKDERFQALYTLSFQLS